MPARTSLAQSVAAHHLRGQDVASFTDWDLIHAAGSPLWALLYSRLFWPELLEVNDLVLLHEHVEDEADRSAVLAFYSDRQDKTETEKSFNSVEVPTLFGKETGCATENDYLQLAQLMCYMWQARLRQAYPRRRFLVEVIPAEEGTEISVTFYEEPGP